MLFKDISTIADYAVMRTGGVAGIAQINGLRLEAKPARHAQQAINGVAPAGVIVIDILGPQLLDRLRGRAIQLLRGFIVVIVTQVRADDDQGFRTAPEKIEHLADFPGPGIAHHQLVGIDEANFKKARKFYESATQADPNYAHAWNNLGTLHYSRKDYKKAIGCYQRALKMAPAQAAFHSNLGTAFFARKKYAEAFEEYRVALLLDPEVFDRHGLFGVILKEQTVEDRARYQFLLAKGFASLGYVEKSLAYLRRALEDGFSPAEAQGDPAFALLRDDPRFQALFAELPRPIPR